MTTPPPPPGQMYLFDSCTPPLDDGSYRLTVETDVTYSNGTPGFSQQYFFNIVGPRFSIPQSMVAHTSPPANSHGAFQDVLPHIALSRRTLPWERPLFAPPRQVPTPTQTNPAPPAPPVPWVALLVFQEGEYTWLPNTPLEQIVPPGVFANLGSPTGIVCDAVEAPLALVQAILPSVEEMQLLAHVRWVNVNDSELNTAGGDGYFSIVVANRLPAPGAQCRAILVSLEERSDLVQADPPPQVVTPSPLQNRPIVKAPVFEKAAAPEVQRGIGMVAGSTVFTLSSAPTHTFNEGQQFVGFPLALSVRLVALTSWKFACEGLGTFRNLMQNLDVSMFGTVANPGHPPLSDTGHLQIALQDRLGAMEQVWYRGPLVPFQLTRDTLGPYHSADQARRVTPETGAEDISYSAGFEVGRLLAAADARLAQALMRWRREAYKQSARASTITALAAWIPLNLPATLAEQLHTPVAPLAGAAAAKQVVESSLPLADPHRLGVVSGAPGLNPSKLASAWQLGSAAQATALLGGNAGSLGAMATPAPQTARPATDISAVAADTAGLAQLSSVRTQTLQNAISSLEKL